MLATLIPLIAIVGALLIAILGFLFLPTPLAWLIFAVLFAISIYVLRKAAERPFH